MSTSESLEKWHRKCEEAHIAQETYNEDPTPTNYSALQKALYERGLMEEEMDSDASHSHRP
ncbi:hypothetical protein CLH62_07530 [Marinobacter guineae]|uniref:Uncharacterized protein n=1 Tax=Marinobacter guineae TaxID=432303 RepID=A0A2G1VKX3_9GAMM|nr:hypothetical protein [Marinobacter guineae]PHQ27408.1 hypothetical protein CLH62_07530 [Marinobacter guineae]